jgi:hypothetical protein
MLLQHGDQARRPAAAFSHALWLPILQLQLCHTFHQLSDFSHLHTHSQQLPPLLLLLLCACRRMACTDM